MTNKLSIELIGELLTIAEKADEYSKKIIELENEKKQILERHETENERQQKLWAKLADNHRSMAVICDIASQDSKGLRTEEVNE